MGLERCFQVRLGGVAGETALHVEGDRLILRAPFSNTVMFSDLTGVAATNGAVTAGLKDGRRLVVQAGEEAEDIVRRIVQPKSRIEKLGVKTAHTIALLGFDDPVLRAEIAAGGAFAVAAPAPVDPGVAMVILEANSPAELAPLAEAATLGLPQPFWIVSAKGKAATLKDVEIMRFADALGYVATKVMAFDASRTALRLARRKS
jgi:hypothetical protein